MTFEEWYETVWRWGSSTDKLRAERAWVMARASLQELIGGLVRDRARDTHLGEACEYLIEAGKFYEVHPELEPNRAESLG